MLELAFAALLSMQTPQDEGPIVTGARGEAADALRMREAIAYSNPLPAGAPTQDYPLVAWCEALVNGHVALGETLTDHDAEDVELIRLARLEAQDFHGALAAATPRQTAAAKAAADRAAAEASAKWTQLLANPDETVRSQAFGLFFGLPGRCEHAARRIRANITTPPVTPEEVGLTVEPEATAN
ncbi:MAG: hypothetical protein EON96_02415 [Caulobacteraceae bacterium]|nr:MAG: hypothetical protein EON96_02415 [Caulobacteraceae bacterium]